MINRILLAMSTLPGEKQRKESSFVLDFIDGQEEIVDKCIGQLEPTVKYILGKFPSDELEIDVLSTKDTWSLTNTIDNTDYTAITYFVSRICDYLGYTYNLEGIMPDDFESDKDIIDKKVGVVRFVFIKIDQNAPNLGLVKTVDYLRANQYEDGKFWIDTHGGFRDISLILSAIVSLLKEDGIVPDTTVDVRYNADKSGANSIEPSKAVKMFDFVSAMNEFVQFGSADSLANIYEDSDEEITNVISAMKEISDGTRFCDPQTYLNGLDNLAKAINSVDSSDDYFTIFVDNIKHDYGDLLDDRRRTPLKIIERCYKKKLYQQALTFIESLMPEEYVGKKIVFFNENNTSEFDKVNSARNRAKKEYVSINHFFFDHYISQLYYYSRERTDAKWNDFVDTMQMTEKNVEASLIKRKDYLALDCIKNCKKRADLQKNLSNRLAMRKIDRAWTDFVRVSNNISSNEKRDKAGQLFRLHDAIKRCRNMVNHSSQKMRPSMNEVADAIGVYIELAKEVLGE